MFLITTLGTALLLASSPQAVADTSPRPDSVDAVRVDTYDGILSVAAITPAAGPRLYRVRVDSTTLFSDSTAQMVMLHTLAAWSRRRIAILELVSGGNACPSYYRIVEFADGRTPRVSDEIGNCSDLPEVLMDGARFRIRFPSFYLTYQTREPGFRPPPAVTWEYLGDGRVRRLPATPGASR